MDISVQGYLGNAISLSSQRYYCSVVGSYLSFCAQFRAPSLFPLSEPYLCRFVLPGLSKWCHVCRYPGITQWALTRPDRMWSTGSGLLESPSAGPRFAGLPQGGEHQSQKGEALGYSPYIGTPVPVMVTTTCVPRCGDAMGGMLFRMFWFPTGWRVYHAHLACGGRTWVISGGRQR